MTPRVWGYEQRRTAVWTGGSEQHSGQLTIFDLSSDDDVLEVSTTDLVFGTSYDDDIDD